MLTVTRSNKNTRCDRTFIAERTVNLNCHSRKTNPVYVKNTCKIVCVCVSIFYNKPNGRPKTHSPKHIADSFKYVMIYTRIDMNRVYQDTSGSFSVTSSSFPLTVCHFRSISGLFRLFRST